MNIVPLPAFKKAYQKRIAGNKNLTMKVAERIRMFQTNPQNPLIHDHPLKGVRQNERAFSITGDIRIIYRYVSADSVIFLDIGSHNQVY